MLLADLEIDLLAFKLRRKGADLMLDNPLFPLDTRLPAWLHPRPEYNRRAWYHRAESDSRWKSEWKALPETARGIPH